MHEARDSDLLREFASKAQRRPSSLETRCSQMPHNIQCELCGQESGVKESVLVWVPVFFVFIGTHGFGILLAVTTHLSVLPQIAANTAHDVGAAQRATRVACSCYCGAPTAWARARTPASKR